MICLILLFLLPVYCLNCSPSNRGARREWGSLSGNERKEYINAIRCMQTTPSILSREKYPGIRHRMDDFTVVHISYAPHIHSNGALLAWHREFLWRWEQALRQECGYQGYWDWSLHAKLTDSPLFDSSPTSLSGDGDPDADLCVTTGPLANMTVHFSQKNGPNLELPPNIFDYTPHCLSRHMNSSATARFANAAVIRRVLASPDIITFQERIDISADPAVRAREFGPHAAGHEAMMGTMRDFFSSPQDPVFMLHHGMIDRIWAMWQALDEENHRWAINGTMSLHNFPLTPELTLDTNFGFGVLGRDKKMRELMHPQMSDYCYEYGNTEVRSPMIFEEKIQQPVT
ncbi:unnamed protein product [Penicillium pancosmium]